MVSRRISYQEQQCSRVHYEGCRTRASAYAAAIPRGLAEAAERGSDSEGEEVQEASYGGLPQEFGRYVRRGRYGGGHHVEAKDVQDVPSADTCIGQVVMDWEWIHDLDLHLLKVSPECEWGSVVDPVTNELKLVGSQHLETIVSYRNKLRQAEDGTPQAVLELDRNAAVHSIKPVENLYLTQSLEPGVYVVGIHNYSQRQLRSDVVGSAKYPTYEDFKKKEQGYLMMEKALADQAEHANDEDSEEKAKIMAEVDEAMKKGFDLLQELCEQGEQGKGVHYGVTVYSYPSGAVNPKHPQGASLEELQNDFRSEFFATSECIFDPEANPHGYNGASVMADRDTVDGTLALSNNMAAHVAALRVTRDGSGQSRVEEIRMLGGKPRSSLTSVGSGQPANELRRQRLSGTVRRTQLQQGEPAPEPGFGESGSSPAEPQGEDDLVEESSESRPGLWQRVRQYWATG